MDTNQDRQPVVQNAANRQESRLRGANVIAVGR